MKPLLQLCPDRRETATQLHGARRVGLLIDPLETEQGRQRRVVVGRGHGQASCRASRGGAR